MGCWNKTCGLTQLPIFWNEPVVTFIILKSYKSDNESSPSYSNAFWNIVPLPIYGKYNDYGWMEEDEGQEWKLQLLNDIFGKYLHRLEPYKTDSGYVRYPNLKDNPFDSFKTLGDCIHGGVFALDNKIGKHKSTISAIMIHARSFNELSEKIYRDYPKTVITKDKLIEYYSEFLKIIPTKENIEDRKKKYYSQLNAASESTFDENEFNFLFMDGLKPSIDKFIEEKFSTEKYYHNNQLSWVLNFWFSNESYSSNNFYNKEFTRECRYNFPAKDAVDGWMVGYLFDILRKQIYPMGHEGSQAVIYPIHETFAKVYTNRINDYKNEYDFEDDDEEEEA